MNALIAWVAALVAAIAGGVWLVRRLPELEFPEEKLFRLEQARAVAETDSEIEHLRTGGEGDDELGAMLAAWRDEARGGERHD